MKKFLKDILTAQSIINKKGGGIIENLICHVEECKYNHAKACSAKEITVSTNTPQMKAVTPSDTACEKFECRNNCR